MVESLAAGLHNPVTSRSLRITDSAFAKTSA